MVRSSQFASVSSPFRPPLSCRRFMRGQCNPKYSPRQRESTVVPVNSYFIHIADLQGGNCPYLTSWNRYNIVRTPVGSCSVSTLLQHGASAAKASIPASRPPTTAGPGQPRPNRPESCSLGSVERGSGRCASTARRNTCRQLHDHSAGADPQFAQGSLVHFGGCNVVDIRDEDLDDFMARSGVVAVSGFTEEIRLLDYRDAGLSLAGQFFNSIGPYAIPECRLDLLAGDSQRARDRRQLLRNL